MVHSGYSGRLCSPLVNGVCLSARQLSEELVWPKLSEKFGHGIREQKRVFCGGVLYILAIFFSPTENEKNEGKYHFLYEIFAKELDTPRSRTYETKNT